jgi:hypothetical protein
MVVVVNAAALGLKLHGGTDALGFLFFYELLTDTLRLRVLTDDKPFALASLLVRCLPPAEWQAPSELMSVLRAVSDDYALSHRMPKYKDDRRFKLLGSVDVSRKLLKAVAEQFSRETSVAVLLKKWAPFEAPATVCVAPARDMQRRLRIWAVPRAANLSCRQRTLKPVHLRTTANAADDAAGDATYAHTRAELEAHAGCLLGPAVANPARLAGGGCFAEALTRASCGEAPVPTTLPFDVSKHPAAGSHVAKDMVRRCCKLCFFDVLSRW